MHLAIVDHEAAEAYRNGKTLEDNPYLEELHPHEYPRWVESFNKEKEYWEGKAKK